MDDLIAFLRARIAEREQRAHGWDNVDYDENLWVLDDVAAKRQLVDEYQLAASEAMDDPANDEVVHYARGLERAVRVLAQAFATQPGYRAAWRP